MSDQDTYIVCLVEKDGYRRYHISREGTPTVAVREAFDDIWVSAARNVREAYVVRVDDMEKVEVPTL